MTHPLSCMSIALQVGDGGESFLHKLQTLKLSEIFTGWTSNAVGLCCSNYVYFFVYNRYVLVTGADAR